MISFFKELTLEARHYFQDDDKTWRNKRMDEAVAIIDSEKIRALFADYPLAEAEIREWIATEAFPTEGEMAFRCSFKYIGKMTTNANVYGTNYTFTISYDPDIARCHLERALELRSVHLGPNDLKTLETMRQLGKTIVCIDAGKGLEVLNDGLERSNATFGPDHDETLRYLDSLAGAYEVAEKTDEAVRVWQDVYTRTKIKGGRDSNDALNRSDTLAAAYEKAGRIESKSSASTSRVLAAAYEKAGRIEEALRQREESLRGRRKLATESIDLDAVDFGLLSEELEGRRKLAAGSIDYRVGFALREVARLYEQMQDHARAEALWREALPFFKDNEDWLVPAQESLGRCLLHRGKFADAEPVLRECLAIFEKKNPDDLSTFYTKSLLGAALLGQRKYADAERMLMAGYEGVKKRLDPLPQEDQKREIEKMQILRTPLIEFFEPLVQLYEATGKKDRADAWRKKLQEARKKLQEAKNAAKNPAKP